LLFLAALVTGCGFLTLREDIEQAGTEASLEGFASARGTTSPIVVVVQAMPGENLVDFFLLPRPGPFFFTLPAGTYRLAAFEDRNRDLAHQPAEEPAVVFGDPAGLVLGAGERRDGIALALDPNHYETAPLLAAAPSGVREVGQYPAMQLGTIVDIDDPRFTQENGDLGLWDPLRFLFEVGAGIYFLEPYDPKKIPVLFVHGATGYPAQWSYLIDRLERDRFQPWLVYYPTAPHLEQIATGVVRALAALQFRHGFTRVILVAHSMGGLVTRAALNFAMQSRDEGRVVQVPAFVSISSPWGGHRAAEEGVKHAPVVAPSWEDMAPGSSFLVELPRTPLPSECEYSLFFSYGGDGSLFAGGANDGTVALSSELSMPIQHQAIRVMGFDETHTGILSSPEVAEALNVILEKAIVGRP